MVSVQPQQLPDLPWHDVIYQHIFPRLSVVELCRLAAVSRAFHRVSKEYFHTCKEIDVSDYNMTDDDFRMITLECRNLQRLSVARCSWLSDGPLITLFRQSPNLVYVDLRGCCSLNGGALQILAVKCKKLKFLLVDGCPWFTGGSLQALTLHQSELLSFSTGGCWGMEDQDIAKFFQKFTKIKEIRLNDVEAITDASLYHLAMSCSDLETLSLAGCWRVTDQGLKKVVDSCSKMQCLDVRRCSKVSEKFLCCLHTTGLKITSNYPLADMIRSRKHVDRLMINVQI
ncbi:F-box/LRR-repeat protein 15-like isoform X2 [Eriocheir sinensis]|uniref:F-box/LRR-repeat protein 15-like isoform X2 n=1 Tax=Eriocheir sinensis TaxID=95602 RepID=UPI0021C93340|nr:F-box/LRR-repeat protein 15-like isoform X2 [Eriocheir sinensis]